MAVKQNTLERPSTKAKVIALVLEGKSDAEVAHAISTPKRSISRQAITLFRKRHAAELTTAVAVIEKQITDYAIAHKVNRIAEANRDYERLGEVIEARAADERYDEPGYATGLMVHTLKQIGTGKTAELVDEFKVDTAVIAERRALRRAVAEELAQLPRPDVNVHNNFVLVRQLIGFNPEEIG